MEQLLKASVVGRWFLLVCTFFSNQWQQSKVVSKFLTPAEWGGNVGKSSMFYRLWQLLRSGLTTVYNKLQLEKIFGTSVIIRPQIWCFMVVASVGLLPTMVLLGLILVQFCFLLLEFIRNPKKEPVTTPMNRYIILYAILYVVSCYFSTTPAQSMMVGGLSCMFILFAVGLQNAIDTQKSLDYLVKALVLSATLVALYGIYQYIFRTGYQSEAWVDGNMFSSITFRVVSTMENPNMLGQFFILAIPLGGVCLLSAKSWEARTLWFACCALMCITMLLTFSRGAWLGLLFAGAAFFILLSPRLIALIPVALIALYFVLPATIIERFISIGDLQDASTSYRVFIWIGTLAMLKDYWICGVGAGDTAFNLVYPKYSYSGVIAPHSHNLFLQILCDGGVVLLLVFCLMLFHYLRGLCVAISKKSTWDTKLLQVGTTSAMVGFLVQAMTDYSFYNYRVMLLFWVMVGIGGRAMVRDQLPQEGRE